MDVAQINEEMMEEIRGLTGASMKDVDAFTDLVPAHGLPGALSAWALQKGFAPAEIEKGAGLAIACSCLTHMHVTAAIIQAGMKLGARKGGLHAAIQRVGVNGIHGIRGTRK